MRYLLHVEYNDHRPTYKTFEFTSQELLDQAVKDFEKVLATFAFGADVWIRPEIVDAQPVFTSSRDALIEACTARDKNRFMEWDLFISEDMFDDTVNPAQVDETTIIAKVDEILAA